MNRFNSLIFLGFFMLLIMDVNAQGTVNYALNGSFEDISKCPNGEGEIINAKYYFQSIGTTTDLFARCGSPEVGVPKNRLGTMNAYHGNNMAGIMATTKGYSYYDYIIGTLDYKNMIPGQSYCVSMKVSLAWQSPWAIDQLAIYFCDSSSWFATKYSNGVTHYNNPLVWLNYTHTALGLDQDLTVREKWITIKGIITYSKGMKYFWIGANHKVPKSLTPVNDVQKVFNPDKTVYYYVDDIKIFDSNNDPKLFKISKKGGCKSTVWTIAVNDNPDSVFWYLDGNLYQKGNSSKIDFPMNLNSNNLTAYAYYSGICNPIMYSPDPSIDYKAPDHLLTYYPNPTTTGLVNLNLYQKGKIHSTIYDICGRKIREIEFPAEEKFNTIQIDVSNLVPAIYLIETKTNDCYLIDKVLVE
jgi:hypothetical protein